MKKNVYWMGGILLALVLAAYLVLQRSGEQSISVEEGTALFSLDSASVDRIEITSPAGTIRFERKGIDWYLRQPVMYRADQPAVTSLIHSLKSLEAKSIVSTNPEKQTVFEVDTAKSRMVSVYEKGMEKIVFYAGKMGPSYLESYLRKKNSNDVLLVQPSLNGIVDRALKEWRDKTILNTPKENLKEIEFQYPNEKFSLTFRDSVWSIVSQKADANEVKTFLDAAASIQADNFIDSAFVPPAKPSLMLSFAGARVVLYDLKDKYAVHTSLSPQWFELQSYNANKLLKHKKDFLKK